MCNVVASIIKLNLEKLKYRKKGNLSKENAVLSFWSMKVKPSHYRMCVNEQ